MFTAYLGVYWTNACPFWARSDVDAALQDLARKFSRHDVARATETTDLKRGLGTLVHDIAEHMPDADAVELIAELRRRFEVAAAEAMFQVERLPTLSTTNKSIEEISSKVLSTLGLQREMF